MRSHRMMFAEALASAIVSEGLLSSLVNATTHWGDDQARRAASEAQAEADAARYAAAQAKRDRKNAKRLRDANGAPDA